MNVHVEKEQKSPVEYSLKVTVPAEEMTGRIETALKQVSTKASIPGFRPGKAPRKVLMDKYGSAITQEAVQDALQDAYRTAVQDSGLEPVAPGEMDEIHFEPGNPLTFSVNVEVLPDIEIPDLSKTEVQSVKPVAEDADIAAALDNLRESAAKVVPSDGAATAESIVTVDLQEIDDAGVPLVGRVQRDVAIDMRRQRFGEEFASKVIGLKSGQSAIVTFAGAPDDKGKTRSLRLQVTVNKVEQKELPPLDDSLAALVNPNMTSLDELKADLKKYLEARALFQARQQMYRAVADDLLRRTDFPVPPRMLGDYLDRMAEEGAASNQGEKPDEKAIEHFKTEYRASAIWNLRWYMLRSRIIEEYGLTVEQKDMDAEILRLATLENMPADELRKKLTKEQKRHIHDDLMERKLFEFLESKIKTVNSTVPLAEFEGRAAEPSKIVTV